MPEKAPRKSFYQELLKGQTTKFVPKKVKGIQTEILDITPLQAKHILKHYNNSAANPNRKPSRVVVSKYASDMLNGDWKKTGQTLQFSSEGMLMDGQHRLLAVVETGIPQSFIMVYGLDKSAFDVIDNGKSRTYADVAGIKGYRDPIILTALARWMIAHEATGDLGTDKAKFRHAGVNQITKSQVMKYL